MLIEIIGVAGQAAQNFVNSQFNIYGVKEGEQEDTYDIELHVDMIRDYVSGDKIATRLVTFGKDGAQDSELWLNSDEYYVIEVY